MIPSWLGFILPAWLSLVEVPRRHQVVTWAILFIVFDLETILLVPWAVVARELGWAGFGAVSIFVLVLAVGLIYEWKRGGLQWE